MKITQLLILTTTSIVLHSMSTLGTVDAWWNTDGDSFFSVRTANKASTCSKCSGNGHCHTSEKCMNGECVSACREEECICKHTICLAREHKAECVCKPDYIKDKKTGKCVENGRLCSKDEDCHTSEQCKNSVCRNACLDRNCTGVNEICFAVGHASTCECKPKFLRSHKTTNECERSDCITDEDCLGLKKCLFFPNFCSELCACDGGSADRGHGYCGADCLDRTCPHSSEICDGDKYCNCPSGKKYNIATGKCQ